jgi:hypothetical protein
MSDETMGERKMGAGKMKVLREVKEKTEDRLLILDLDGTLIGMQSTLGLIYPRRKLSEFFRECRALGFELAIWSAASPVWVEYMRKKLFPNERFLFIWSEDHCIWTLEDAGLCAVKFLYHVWRKSPQYHQRNTLIIDDNPDSYKYNYPNAIPIKGFLRDDDNELDRVLSILRRKVTKKDLRRRRLPRSR